MSSSVDSTSSSIEPAASPPVPDDSTESEGPDDWRRLPPDEILRRGASAFGVAVSDEQAKACLRYLDLLLEWNARINLTAIRDPHDALVKHFLDPMTLLPLLPDLPDLRLADVGTGAGFPGLVLKLMRPGIRLLLLDSVRKRLTFLERVVADLNLCDVEVQHARAEDAGRDRSMRERFHVVTARAVADLPVLAELCMPLVRTNGRFMAMKGPRGEEELRAAEPAIETLGGGTAEVHRFTLPYLHESRIVLSVPRERPTPARYPRRPAEITAKPL